jgi:hypothetical protein
MAKKSRLNAQGLARRSVELVGCIKPLPGHATVSVDFASGEPTVTSHFSRDPNYLYSTFEGVGKDPFWKNGVLMIDDIYLMTMSISPIHRRRIEEAFRDSYDGLSFVEAWRKDPDIVKKRIKKEREFTKAACLAEGTLIRVRDRGWVPIERVSAGDVVWDGGAWVITDGAISKGAQPVIEKAGQWMTEDHRLLSKTGWTEAKDCDDPLRFDYASTRWADVWAMARAVVSSGTTWKSPLYLCRLWAWAAVERLRQLAVG